MKRYVIANWKCHKSSEEGCRWLDMFASRYKPCANLEVVIAPTFIAIENVAAHLTDLSLSNVYLAAQDVSPFPKGSYTGAIASDMLQGMAKFVILGHSERRRYFHETNQEVANKASEAVDAGLTPIVCVDSSFALSQLASLVDIDSKNIMIAYTPVDALHFNIPESPEKVLLSVGHISQLYPDWSVVYGGALGENNVKAYLGLQGLAGVFVGSASLDPKTFVEICNRAAEFC